MNPIHRLAGVVRGCSRSRALRSNVGPGHATIDNEVAAIDKASLVRGQKQNSLGLLNSLAKATRGEVNLTPVALGLVVSQPVLEERSVQRRRAEGVEAEALACVNNGELAGHGEDCTLGCRVGELRSGGSDESDDRGSVDDAALGLLVLAKREDSVLAAEPHALNVDVLGHVPDLLGCVDGV